MRIEMPDEVEWIIGKIREQGFSAFAVGGCVRDTILGRVPEDWDITTSAKPGEVKEIFPRTVDTGLKHGTVTVIRNRKGYEVTTYRIDGEYHDGRHPDSVEFTKNLEEDLKRRDFTINAMAYSHETGVVDIFGGMEDLKKGIIRCVGSPEERFGEDALRILRAVRFAAQLNFSIQEETLAAVGEIAPNLLKVSRERIHTELLKLLLSQHPEKMVMVKETGISRYVSEKFDQVFSGYPENRQKEALQMIAGLPAEKSMRWAGFLRYSRPEDTVRILKGLKSDNETIGNVKAMVSGFGNHLPAEKTAVRRLMSRTTSYQMEGILKLKALEEEFRGLPEKGTAGRLDSLRREILDAGDCISLKTMAVNGQDLMAAGIKPGKEIGEALSGLFELVLERPEWNRKDILLEKLKDRL